MHVMMVMIDDVSA